MAPSSPCVRFCTKFNGYAAIDETASAVQGCCEGNFSNVDGKVGSDSSAGKAGGVNVDVKFAGGGSCGAWSGTAAARGRSRAESATFSSCGKSPGNIVFTSCGAWLPGSGGGDAQIPKPNADGWIVTWCASCTDAGGEGEPGTDGDVKGDAIELIFAMAGGGAKTSTPEDEICEPAGGANGFSCDAGVIACGAELPAGSACAI